MSNSLVIERSPKGKSTLHTITAKDGTLVGKRVSKNRKYDFAVVYLRDKSEDLAAYREKLFRARHDLAKWEAMAAAPTAEACLAIERGGETARREYATKWPTNYASKVKHWKEGWYSSNGNNEIYAKRIAEYEAKIAAIEDGSMDAKYAAGSVYSWHSRLDLAMKQADQLQFARLRVKGIAKFVDA